MPKLRKEKIDEVNKLIDEGYNNTEIHEKTGVSRGTISKIRKQRIPTEEPKEISKQTDSGLSSDSMTKIGYMQGMYGAKSPDEAIEKLYEDAQILMPLKYRFDNDVKKTPGQVLSKVVEVKDKKVESWNNIINAENSTFHQMILFHGWGIDTAIRAFYDMIPPETYKSVFHFMVETVIGFFMKQGYKIEYYWYAEHENHYPIITCPSGLKIKFPIKDDDLEPKLADN